MKHYLEVQFTLSGPLPPESKGEIEELFKQFTEKTQESRDKGEFKITEWKTKGTKLDITISSVDSLSPHVAVLRLRKKLSAAIGKKYRVGLRGFAFIKYIIETELEEKPVKEFTLPLVKNLEFFEEKGKSYVKIEIDPEIEEDFVEKGAIERIVRRVGEKISKQHYGAKREHHQISWYSGEKKHHTEENPTQMMQKANWIQRTNYRNQWILSPTITALAEALKHIMIDYVYEPLGFNQMMIPKLVDWSIWLRSEHAEGIYQGGFEPYFVVQPKSADPEYFEEIADYITITKTIPLEKLAEKVSAPIGGLSYAQCPPFWAWIQGKTLAKESLPIKVYDWSGPTYRYESGSAYGFERVDELHRIETLFIGSPEQVKQIGMAVKDKLRVIFEEVLDLEVREAKVTPWWLQQSAHEDEMDSAEDLVVGTIDYEAYMPYRGSREESEWLEIQNISIIGQKYPKGFSVKAEGNIELWSGCGGGSFERFLTAFISQKGLDKDNWPNKFLKYIDKLPEPVKFH
ncbi:MAG: serine--tRNA ligase [Candidatus Heimdallarchaeota archaeon]|nr:serine--tRNA ligase [Candidatus Heimdallarchaeota archaeon]MCG3256792.1 serine--tRNA ligase [Candidatus Heimdallarchaeota archaeon]MCK4611855.1 serine--tRNA ligase [Candidatus Heimdallarchaeota archaeon]